MGNQNQRILSNEQQLLKLFVVKDKVKEYNATYLEHINDHKSYLLREANYNIERQHEEVLSQLRNRELFRSPFLTNLARVQTLKEEGLCSKFFKIFSLWEFPRKTLAQENTQRALYKKAYNPQEIRMLLQQLSEGLITLKKQGIYHECLTSKLILVEQPLKVRVVDPICLPMHPNHQLIYHNRSLKNIYLSPEQCRMIDQQDIYRHIGDPFKEDVFTAGMLVLESGLLQRQDECYEEGCARINWQQLNKNLNRFQERYGPELRNILGMMLQRESLTRMDWAQLLRVVQNQPRIQPTPIKDLSHPRRQPFPTTVAKGLAVPQRFTRVQGSPVLRQTLPVHSRPIYSPNRSTLVRVEDYPPVLHRISPIRHHLPLAHRISPIRHPVKFVQHVSPIRHHLPVVQRISPVRHHPLVHRLSPVRYQLPLVQRISPPHVINHISPGKVARATFQPNLRASFTFNYQNNPQNMYRSSLPIYNNAIDYQTRDLPTNKVYEYQARPTAYTSYQPATSTLLESSTQTKKTKNTTQTFPDSQSSQLKTDSPKAFNKKEKNDFTPFDLNQNEPIYVIQQFKNGSRYQGYKCKGKRQGWGKYQYTEGGYYEGEWKNDLMSGKGKLYYESGKIAYDGYLEQDLFHGLGVLYNQVSEPLNTLFNHKDFQEIEDYWVKYDGQFRNDKKQGHGLLLLTNGQYFEGSFHDDKIQGEGVYHTMQGRKIRGIWHQNKFQRQL